jgi:hypothetical protein
MSDFAGDDKSELQRKGEQLFWIACLETITYALLFFFWQIVESDAGTTLMGWFHGWVVAAFAVMVVWITPAIRWRWWFSVFVIATGPVGAAVAAARLRRTDWQALDARRRAARAGRPARTAATAPPARPARPAPPAQPAR